MFLLLSPFHPSSFPLPVIIFTIITLSLFTSFENPPLKILTRNIYTIILRKTSVEVRLIESSNLLQAIVGTWDILMSPPTNCSPVMNIIDTHCQWQRLICLQLLVIMRRLIMRVYQLLSWALPLESCFASLQKLYSGRHLHYCECPISKHC